MFTFAYRQLADAERSKRTPLVRSSPDRRASLFLKDLEPQLIFNDAAAQRAAAEVLVQEALAA